MSFSGAIFTDDQRDRTLQIGAISSQQIIDDLAFQNSAVVINLPELLFGLRLVDAVDEQVLHCHAGSRLNTKAEFLHATSLA